MLENVGDSEGPFVDFSAFQDEGEINPGVSIIIILL